MPGHGNILHYLNNAPNAPAGSVHDSKAWCSLTCPHCGERVNAAVVALVHNEAPVVRWLRCQACNRGIVENNGQMAPHPLPGQAVDGLPADVEAADVEARQTAGVGAFTSSELMCRKILMHVAVDKGADEGKTFVSYIDYLKTTGYITPPMIPWIDLIRSHGNESTHRLNPATAERATNTLMFTTQLLRLVYEMDHRAQQFVMPSAAVE